MSPRADPSASLSTLPSSRHVIHLKLAFTPGGRYNDKVMKCRQTRSCESCLWSIEGNIFFFCGVTRGRGMTPGLHLSSDTGDGVCVCLCV